MNDDTKFAKAHQAIGQYFSEFSELERELGEAVKVVLHLEKHDAADIVVAALRYPSTKASLVRAAAEIAKKKDGSETSTEWKAKADKTLGEIIKHSNGSRNTLAHSASGTSGRRLGQCDESNPSRCRPLAPVAEGFARGKRCANRHPSLRP